MIVAQMDLSIYVGWLAGLREMVQQSGCFRAIPIDKPHDRRAVSLYR
jgi:hypothetical protein